MYRKILILIGLTLTIATCGYAFDDGDFQVWHTENQEWNINKSTRITLEEEFRFGDGSSDFYYQHYDIGFVYSMNQHLDLGLNYRQVYEKINGDFKIENRPHMNAILKYDLWGFKLDDRNRFEYRHFDFQEDFWRYRNKFTLTLPWKFTRFKIQPYLADEGFLDLNTRTFSRNRFYAGLGFTLIKNLKGEIYYLLQTSRGCGKWTNANVLGTKLKIIF